MPNSGGFWVLKHRWKLWMQQIGISKSSASFSGPLGTQRWCHPWEGDRTLHRVSQGLAVCHAGPRQGIPTAALHCASLAQTQCWPPRLGASQVLERSWERIPWPGCSSAPAPGDPCASPCQGLISQLTCHCLESTSILLPWPAASSEQHFG